MNTHVLPMGALMFITAVARRIRMMFHMYIWGVSGWAYDWDALNKYLRRVFFGGGVSSLLIIVYVYVLYMLVSFDAFNSSRFWFTRICLSLYIVVGMELVLAFETEHGGVKTLLVVSLWERVGSQLD